MVGIVLITSEPYRQDTEVQITVIPVIICLASIILDVISFIYFYLFLYIMDFYFLGSGYYIFI